MKNISPLLCDFFIIFVRCMIVIINYLCFYLHFFSVFFLPLRGLQRSACSSAAPAPRRTNVDSWKEKRKRDDITFYLFWPKSDFVFSEIVLMSSIDSDSLDRGWTSFIRIQIKSYQLPRHFIWILDLDQSFFLFKKKE